MSKRVTKGGLKIDAGLYDLINSEVLPGTGIDEETVWQGLASILESFSGRNKALLIKRNELQTALDNWYVERQGQAIDTEEYQAFLKEIGYLVTDEVAPFSISPNKVDDEIASIAGPQLVVPVNNARFALNATNARWGSLYDALYGTNVIPFAKDKKPGKAYDPIRGGQVIQWASEFLDKAIPLADGVHANVSNYEFKVGQGVGSILAELVDGSITQLKDPEKFVGVAERDNTQVLLFKNNDLHIELLLDPSEETGKAALKDVLLESAISTIIDCEDSVAAVDAQDKVVVYRNWLGLMKGTLEEKFEKGGQMITRSLNPDRAYVTANGAEYNLSGRSLLLVRNVGHLMTTDAVLDSNNDEIPEGVLDTLVTSLCAVHDLQKNSVFQNSKKGSIYIVKPKMHGPEEAAFTNDLFAAVENVLGLEPYTLKVGLMDEEKRTSVNLKACIHAVKERLVFINTGFLDRTGDEIHTCMQAGPVLPKALIKEQSWITAYEDRNVDIGIECGLRGQAQIGKGMWPKPDEMLEMMETKMAAPMSGANCAWVPSPTAATLHATHYHQVNVVDRQAELATREKTDLAPLLTAPLLNGMDLSEEQIQFELDNNAQGILGYVVRWIDQGIGCSKVPDINHVGLMEDRATLRISSQHLANWLFHGICSESQVTESLERMAAVVDGQNASDANYKKMSPDFNSSIAFKAASALVFQGCEQPNGYTEPLLHAMRRETKA
ncbi:malate synthase G [Leucothrix arctica]|uniref:Malate synthase G n=1 Tax=Leucothrix arctica TaxID=1481894 RepID=A0A317CFW1_9GAMM|nr:malate synthase G [Leucothrix arctica]PWQ97474.1 malate synthase G [Leucothrix arctica]